MLVILKWSLLGLYYLLEMATIVSLELERILVLEMALGAEWL